VSSIVAEKRNGDSSVNCFRQAQRVDQKKRSAEEELSRKPPKAELSSRAGKVLLG